MAFLSGTFSQNRTDQVIRLSTVRKRDRKEILFLMIGDRNAKQDAEALCSSVLFACRQGDSQSCADRVADLLEKMFGQENLSGAAFFGIGDECVYAWTPGFCISLFHLSFNRPCGRRLSDAGKGLERGTMEAGIGLLLCPLELYGYVSEEALVQWLFGQYFETKEQLEWYLREKISGKVASEVLEIAYLSVREEPDRERFLIQAGYRKPALIGSGAFGKVYRGRKKGKVYAIKFSEGCQATSLLRREAAYLGQINHEAFPRLFSFSEDQQSGMLVMEYVCGKSLQEILDHRSCADGRSRRFNRKLQRKDCILAVCIAQGLSYLHNLAGCLVYRDLKPANIIVEPSGKAKLLDLGSACYLKEAGESCSGSTAYMAPEVLKGEKAGPESDIFSFGRVCCQIFAGEQLPESLFKWIQGSLAEDPKKRPSLQTFPLTFSEERDILIDSIKVDY